jgi:hypothetical protein
MLGALTLAALALPMTLTYSTFELIEGAAVRRLENATAAHGRPLGSQLTSSQGDGGNSLAIAGATPRG